MRGLQRGCRGGRVGGCGPYAACPAHLDQEPQQVAAAEHAGGHADGDLAGAEGALGGEVGRHQEGGAHQGGRDQGHARGAGEAAGQLRGGQGDEGDGAGRGGRGGGEQHRGQHGDEPDAFDAHPERPGRVVAHLGDAQVPRLDQQDGHQHRARAEQRPDLGPVAAVEGAADPDHCAGGVHEVRLDQQVAVDGREDRGAADADEHQPVALHPAAPRQRVDAEAGEQPAADGARGDLQGGAVQHHDDEQRAGRRALAEADDVGAAQRVAGDGLEGGPRHAQRGADQQRHHDPRQPQLPHDEVLARGAVPGEGAQHVGRRDVVVPRADEDDARGQGDEQQPDPDEGGPPVEAQREGAARAAQHGPGVLGAVHSSAVLPRRTRAMKTGPPRTAVTMPTWRSAGRASSRPSTSEPSSSTGDSTAA
jgi:hypothetical protein